MPRGVIKWFDSVRGYGFVVTDGGSQELYLSWNAMVQSGLSHVEDGQHVDVTIGPRADGKDAVASLSLCSPE
ncbi:cold-shock protein [Anianabacter salinae]|uniref:cold-shock protein n=1 Tax=Anianabacter salinae TaxID=2851023 RepID=UPI00225E4FA3|nr:cold shock domain-containing protein [Anianabacter salinae]MBV0912088.1 cold shock domain-containing protein [Anianabacter salinae]